MGFARDSPTVLFASAAAIRESTYSMHPSKSASEHLVACQRQQHAYLYSGSRDQLAEGIVERFSVLPPLYLLRDKAAARFVQDDIAQEKHDPRADLRQRDGGNLPGRAGTTVVASNAAAIRTTMFSCT